MAGLLKQIISTRKNKTSKYIDDLLFSLEKKYGKNSPEYNGIYNQFYKMPTIGVSKLTNERHYEAEVNLDGIKGLERLYKRVVVIDLLSACATECVYCLRGYYEKFALTKSDIDKVVNYCSNSPELREVLITGGDPFVATNKLKHLITELAVHAPNIKIVRIGTRLPVHDPNRFDKSFYSFFKTLENRFIIEIACQINHYTELQESSREILLNLQKNNCRIYAQNVLLKDVNDNVETLIKLYDELRYLGITAHYLFHAVPMAGTDNFRTSVALGLELIKKLTSSGFISGRIKPQYALMTDIGKVTLYEDTIIGKEGKNLIIKTRYKLQDRLLWNPKYELPKTASVDKDGYLIVKYLDSEM